MVSLYHRHYGARYESVAELIPIGASVLDVCCGPAVLYDRYLKKKYVGYTGLDISNQFVASARAKGIDIIGGDLNAISELPRADVVVMQASLYQFLPDRVSSVVKKMLKAAREKLIIAEPILNLSASRLSGLARLAQRMTDAGSGPCTKRFNAASLAASMRQFAFNIEGSFAIPGGREMVYVLRSGAANRISHRFDESRVQAVGEATCPLA